jgi:hypothetical protein
MNYEKLKNDYYKTVSFESLIEKGRAKSQEVYFGLDNPLRVGLIHHLTVIGTLIKDAREKNPQIRGLELIDICQEEFNKLGKTISVCFNVEKCVIGFQNAVNAACWPQVYNKVIAGTSEQAKIMRTKLDDIVETKDGFRYKNGKGIYYAVCIGLQLFYGDFTIEEIASIMVHELGHAMQHVVHTINGQHAISYWNNIMYAINMGYIYSLPMKISSIMNHIKKSYLHNEFDKLSEVGEKILDETTPEDMVDFNKLTSHEITAINNDRTPIDGDDMDTIPKKKNLFVRTLLGIMKICLSIPLAIFLVPMMICMKVSLSSKQAGLMKNDEMTADAFEAFYGFAAESGEAERKLARYSKDRGDQGLINYVPLLNLWKCFSDIRQENMSMIFGYPSAKQRIVNAYVACDFELKNNKDLSSEAKKELQNQMDTLRDTYNTFVAKQETKGGFIYKIASLIGRNTIEKAAEKDPSLVESVLKPLQAKKDAGVFK